MLRSSLALALLATVVLAEDLGKRYPATISHADQGLDWRCDAKDVWQLKSFEVALGKDFVLACGKATVALGVHDTNVLWAVVFPEQPAKLRAPGKAGDGEETRAIALRFAPSELEQLFPSKTVVANADAWLRARADHVFRRKLGYKWCTPSGNPLVVPAGIVLVDFDTAEGKRRFFELDRGNAKVTYVAELESKPVPPEAPIAKDDAAKIYDDVWSAFDREYANFVSMPKLDWKQVGAERKKSLARVQTSFDLAAVLADMIAGLEDLHAWVKCGEDWLPGYAPVRPLNASWKGSEKLIGGFQDSKHDVVWGRTSDGIGYVNVGGLSDKELVPAFDAALDELASTWGLVVDLRFNGGGDELLARDVAGRFVDVERVYSKHQYRSGPRHEDLGAVQERRFGPRGPWRYQAPVVVLWGRKVMSSAESLALMLAQCPQVTTMGERTAGSSANPKRLEPGAGITINLPRWRDFDPSGKPIEHLGIEPAVKLELPPSAFTDTTDPVLAAALERLRKPVTGGRKPGKR